MDLLRIERVKARTGLSRSDLYRRVKSGTFPSPIKIGNSRVSVWPSTTVDAWIERQVATANLKEIAP